MSDVIEVPRERWSTSWFVPMLIDGSYSYTAHLWAAHDERDARGWAVHMSSLHGSATVFRNGRALVATYIEGNEWFPSDLCRDPDACDRYDANNDETLRGSSVQRAESVAAGRCPYCGKPRAATKESAK